MARTVRRVRQGLAAQKGLRENQDWEVHPESQEGKDLLVHKEVRECLEKREIRVPWVRMVHRDRLEPKVILVLMDLLEDGDHLVQP